MSCLKPVPNSERICFAQSPFHKTTIPRLSEFFLLVRYKGHTPLFLAPEAPSQVWESLSFEVTEALNNAVVASIPVQHLASYPPAFLDQGRCWKTPDSSVNFLERLPSPDPFSGQSHRLRFRYFPELLS